MKKKYVDSSKNLTDDQFENHSNSHTRFQSNNLMQEQLRRSNREQDEDSGSQDTAQTTNGPKEKLWDVTKEIKGTVYEKSNLKGALEALHTVQNRKTIYLPAGTYEISSPTVIRMNGISFLGDPGGGTVVKLKAGSQEFDPHQPNPALLTFSGGANKLVNIRFEASVNDRKRFTMVEMSRRDKDGNSDYDVDGAIRNCQFGGLDGDTTGGYSQTDKEWEAGSVSSLRYIGRNMRMKNCDFTGDGTAVIVESSPHKGDIREDGEPEKSEYKNGYYGHRKTEILNSTFHNTDRALALQGNWALRGLVFANNQMDADTQMIFSDSAGLTDSVISNNKAAGKDNQKRMNRANKKGNYRNGTIYQANGHFNRNVISGNTIQGKNGGRGQKHGIRLETEDNEQTVIHDNAFGKTNRASIHFEDTAKGAVITENNFAAPRKKGINMEENKGSVVENNAFQKNIPSETKDTQETSFTDYSKIEENGTDGVWDVTKPIPNYSFSHENLKGALKALEAISQEVKVIYIPNGIYHITSPVSVKFSGVRLQGDKKGRTRIILRGGKNPKKAARKHDALLTIDGVGNTLQNLRLEGGGDARRHLSTLAMKYTNDAGEAVDAQGTIHNCSFGGAPVGYIQDDTEWENKPLAAVHHFGSNLDLQKCGFTVEGTAIIIDSSPQADSKDLNRRPEISGNRFHTVERALALQGESPMSNLSFHSNQMDTGTQMVFVEGGGLKNSEIRNNSTVGIGGQFNKKNSKDRPRENYRNGAIYSKEGIFQNNTISGNAINGWSDDIRSYEDDGGVKSPNHAIRVDTPDNENNLIAGNALDWTQKENIYFKNGANGLNITGNSFATPGVRAKTNQPFPDSSASKKQKKKAFDLSTAAIKVDKNWNNSTIENNSFRGADATQPFVSIDEYVGDTSNVAWYKSA